MLQISAKSYELPADSCAFGLLAESKQEFAGWRKGVCRKDSGMVDSQAPGGGKKITCKQCGQVQAKSAFSANQCKKASQGGEARCKACVKASG